MTNSKKMRSGYTTGSSATAASKAAAILLVEGRETSEVEITLPIDKKVKLPIKYVKRVGNKAEAAVVKDGGDDPDVTHGTLIISEVELNDTGINITGGKGVGKITKPGLAISVGQAAINPIPLKMIESEVLKVLPENKGANVVISVPEGEKLAQKTLNPKMGIVDGISILGTTGIVRPMSNTAYIDSLIPQIDQSLALGYKNIVLTPGGMGNKLAIDLGMNPDAIVQTSNFIGRMLIESFERGIENILLFGHIGKLVKVAGGIFNTHSKVADARREILAAHTALLGAPKELIKEIMDSNTAEAVVETLVKNNYKEVFETIARTASRKAEEHVFNKLNVGTVLYSLQGEILGLDEKAKEIGGSLGWKIK